MTPSWRDPLHQYQPFGWNLTCDQFRKMTAMWIELHNCVPARKLCRRLFLRVQLTLGQQLKCWFSSVIDGDNESGSKLQPQISRKPVCHLHHLFNHMVISVASLLVSMHRNVFRNLRSISGYRFRYDHLGSNHLKSWKQPYEGGRHLQIRYVAVCLCTFWTKPMA